MFLLQGQKGTLNFDQRPIFGSDLNDVLNYSMQKFFRKTKDEAMEQDNFLATPAPDFFSKRLRLLSFFPSGSSSNSHSKWPKTYGAWLLVKFGKKNSPKTTNVSLQEI